MRTRNTHHARQDVHGLESQLDITAGGTVTSQAHQHSGSGNGNSNSSDYTGYTYQPHYQPQHFRHGVAVGGGGRAGYGVARELLERGGIGRGGVSESAESSGATADGTDGAGCFGGGFIHDLNLDGSIRENQPVDWYCVVIWIL